MRQLMERLLEGAAVERVLLCDKYVRGEGNLDTLRVFVASIRELNTNAVVEVWTGEDADRKAIERITGTPSRNYREVFDRAAPHDRYLLVRARARVGWGWQMTNSPLDARANKANADPTSPLRWRDLAATRLEGEDLEPALKQWLVGGGK